MTHPYVQDMGSLQSDLGQPLIGIITAQDGDDVVRYFTEEQEADKGAAQNAAEEALALAGAWSDLEWDELEKALASIRYASNPTPPLSL
jgi:hypothetical protein